jgi:NAD(P)-dependent dehydrogenase (short-subunit alcohol dehydrogenase family)
VKRVAAVTGGAGAIGSEIARALGRSDHNVAILDRYGEDRAVPGSFSVDLAHEDDVRRVAHELLSRLGRCDVLVHAAAAFDRASLADIDSKIWRRVQAVNVESVLWLCQELTPGMGERGFGRVVLIVSNTVWDPPADDLLPYIASKATLIGLGRSLSRSLGAKGITVNCVAPGLTSTPAAEAAMSPDMFAAIRTRQAIPRTLTPADVAGVVAFLASDAAAAITGQTLCADGGLVLR